MSDDDEQLRGGALDARIAHLESALAQATEAAQSSGGGSSSSSSSSSSASGSESDDDGAGLPTDDGGGPRKKHRPAVVAGLADALLLPPVSAIIFGFVHCSRQLAAMAGVCTAWRDVARLATGFRLATLPGGPAKALAVCPAAAAAAGVPVLASGVQQQHSSMCMESESGAATRHRSKTSPRPLRTGTMSATVDLWSADPGHPSGLHHAGTVRPVRALLLHPAQLQCHREEEC